MPAVNRSIEFEIGRRVAPRTRCDCVVDISDGANGWQRALMTDFSTTGFRLANLRQPFAGASLWLRPEGMEPIAAKIRWRGDGAAGCQFLYPLREDTETRLRALAEDARSAAPGFAVLQSAAPASTNAAEC